MWIKALKYGTIAGVTMTGLHYTSHAYLYAEQKTLNRFTETRSAVVQDIAQSFGYERPKVLPELKAIELVEKEALARNVNPSLARALMKAESAGQRFAVSKAGAIGPMQIMPFNIARCGLQHYGELFDEETNIKCGIQILAEELQTQKGDVVKALQAYNGGGKCISKCQESIEHARIVLALMARDLK